MSQLITNFHIATFSLLQLLDSGYVLQIPAILFLSFLFFSFQIYNVVNVANKEIKGIENQPNLNWTVKL